MAKTSIWSPSVKVSVSSKYSFDSQNSNGYPSPRKLGEQNQIYRNIFAQVGIPFPEMWQLRHFKIPLRKSSGKSDHHQFKIHPTVLLWRVKQAPDKNGCINGNCFSPNLHLSESTVEYVQKSSLAPHKIIEEITFKRITTPRVSPRNPDLHHWGFQMIKQETPSMLSLSSTVLLRPGARSETNFTRQLELTPESSPSPGALVIVTPKHEMYSEGGPSSVSSFDSSATELRSCRSTSSREGLSRGRFNKFQTYQNIAESSSSESSEKEEKVDDWLSNCSTSPTNKKCRFSDSDIDDDTGLEKVTVKTEASSKKENKEGICSTFNSCSPGRGTHSACNCNNVLVATKSEPENQSEMVGGSIKAQVAAGYFEEENDDVLIIGLNEQELHEF